MKDQTYEKLQLDSNYIRDTQDGHMTQHIEGGFTVSTQNLGGMPCTDITSFY